MTRSTFRLLFYVNGSKEKNGIVPIMGLVTINGTVAQFSCKRSIAKELWDAKGNRAKGKSREARETNLALDNIKEQIIKPYQRISDREAFVQGQETGDLSVTGSGEELRGGVHQVVLQAQRHVYAGTYARLHQGVCGLSLHGSRIVQRHDIGKVHVAERRGDEGAFQRTDTEKSVCAVPHQSECQGA